MKKLALLTAAAVAIVLLPAPAQADPVGGTGWTLRFHDEFDGTAAG